MSMSTSYPIQLNAVTNALISAERMHDEDGASALSAVHSSVKAARAADEIILGWREDDHPEWFCRRTAEYIADRYREARP